MVVQEVTVTWAVVGGGAVATLLTVIAWQFAQATEQLRRINEKMAEISATLAVAVQRVDDHERRITRLEA